MMEILALAVTAILVENLILYHFLGICPFFGVTNSKSSAIGMGFAVLFVITISSLVAWLLYTYVLVPFEMVYMRTIIFILVIASLVQIIEIFIKKVSPPLYKSLGIFLPLITTNCAVLGVATMVANEESTFISTLIFATSSAIGFSFVLFIFSVLRQKISTAPIPEGFKGVPVALITAGIMGMIFLRFSGVI